MIHRTKYYEAIRTGGGYKGRIYQYDETGNKPQVVWLSLEEYPSEAEALDACVEWAEEHDISDMELG